MSPLVVVVVVAAGFVSVAVVLGEAMIATCSTVCGGCGEGMLVCIIPQRQQTSCLTWKGGGEVVTRWGEGDMLDRVTPSWVFGSHENGNKKVCGSVNCYFVRFLFCSPRMSRARMRLTRMGALV